MDHGRVGNRLGKKSTCRPEVEHGAVFPPDRPRGGLEWSFLGCC